VGVVTQSHSAKRHVLEPPGRWSGARLQELWDYRDLLYILAWRDVRVRYKQAVLGTAWAVLQPVVMMGIFTVVFSRIGNVHTGGIPYPVFALAGLVPWTMFANAVGDSSNSLVLNSSLVSKVYFPRILIPTSAMLAWVPDFVIGSVVLFVVIGVYGIVPAWTAVFLPAVLGATMLAILSVGVWLSALNVAYRDVRYAVPFLIQIWLFVTPVAYPAQSIPAGIRWLAGLNPMTWVVDFSRWSLLDAPIAWEIDGLSVLTTVVLLATGVRYFARVQHFFADVI
jgi:lipopolysaccharide transport system permease protein